jgi:hypothetical protein
MYDHLFESSSIFIHFLNFSRLNDAAYAILQAASKNDIGLAQFLVKNNANVEAQSNTGTYASAC